MSSGVDGAGGGVELERLLEGAADDPAQRPAFTAALLGSDVFVLGEVLGPLEEGVAPTGTSAVLTAFGDGEGQFTPFYTSEQRIRETLAARPGTNPRYLRLNCRALFEMTAGARLVLNPDSPYGKVFVPEEIAALLTGREAGMTTETLPAEREVMVGAPAHVPPQLPPALSRFFAQRPVVEAAYLGWIVHPDGHSGYLLVIVAADREQAISGFGTMQIGELTGGPTVDVLVVPPAEPNVLEQVVGPFYARP